MTKIIEAYDNATVIQTGHMTSDPVVTAATRKAERDQYTAHTWIARYADGANPWRAAVEAELEA